MEYQLDMFGGPGSGRKKGSGGGGGKAKTSVHKSPKAITPAKPRGPGFSKDAKKRDKEEKERLKKGRKALSDLVRADSGKKSEPKQTKIRYDKNYGYK